MSNPDITQSTIDKYNQTLEDLRSVIDFSSTFAEEKNEKLVARVAKLDPFKKEELVSRILPKYRNAVKNLIEAYEKSVSNLVRKTEVNEDDLIAGYEERLENQIMKLFIQKVPTLGELEQKSDQAYTISSLSVEVIDNHRESSSDGDQESEEESNFVDATNETLNATLQLNPKPVVKTDMKISKKRASISKDAKTFLESVFETKRTPNSKERQAIAEKCGLTPLQVRVWFTNKRMRTKT